ncbi:hypothetical protein M9H77_10264 [Catharanthus roseus]|uniref:Uncharacterized protein n=1 Tax=Catharanthus roseus TaxID=4058 RepID=A0ACC0C352_CATRO|nr:hypothetical protein M9H77_10264 [Catharanthus roseus]
MSTFSVPLGIGPNPTLLSPFSDRSMVLNPSFRRTHWENLSIHRPFFRGELGVTRFGLGQVPFPDSDGALKDLFGRVEGLLYTIADAAVSGSSDVVNATTSSSTKQSDWLSGITNAMESVLKVLKDGLSTLHIPYSYGFAIILLTVLVKAVTFPLTKKQVESAMAMRSLAPQIKAIQERYAGNQERIQLETARLYKLAGINPLAGCLPTLATIPIWIGLYRALSNVADEGLLTEGFFWIPSLAGPTTIAARQTGSGTSWLFPFIDGHPPLGWSDTLAYLVLPVLLVVSQYISVQIMQPQQSNDPNLKSSQAITKFLPLMIGYFALSVPSGLSLYWFTNNILSTAQQIWLQKLGGAKNPVKALKDDVVMKEQLQMQKAMQEAITKENTTEAGEQSTSEVLRPGERFKQLKEQEARKRKQREEEKRKSEQAAAQEINGELKKETDLVEIRESEADSSVSETSESSTANYHVVNGSNPPRELNDTINSVEEHQVSDYSENGKHDHQPYNSTEKEEVAHSRIGTENTYAGKDMKEDKE